MALPGFGRGGISGAGGGSVFAFVARIAPCLSLRTSRTQLPLGARTSTVGIWPIACVEQLRQGSNVRITASTRFSIPSVSFVATHKVLRHLQNPAVHRQIVVARGDDQVGPGDQPVVVHR